MPNFRQRLQLPFQQAGKKENLGKYLVIEDVTFQDES